MVEQIHPIQRRRNREETRAACLNQRQLSPEDLQREWQRKLDQAKTSGAAMSPAAEDTLLIPSPLRRDKFRPVISRGKAHWRIARCKAHARDDAIPLLVDSVGQLGYGQFFRPV